MFKLLREIKEWDRVSYYLLWFSLVSLLFVSSYLAVFGGE